MKKTLLFFTGKMTMVTLLVHLLITSTATAQQVLQKSYAFDNFDTDGTLITPFVSKNPSGDAKLTLKKVTEDGLLEIDYKQLNGATTNDHIGFIFSTPMDLSALANMRMRIVFENNQDMIIAIAFGNNGYGPYSNCRIRWGAYLYNTEGDIDSLDLKYAATDTAGTSIFDRKNVVSAYILLNPTYTKNNYTAGDTIPAGTLKIHSIKIGANPVAGVQSSEELMKAYVFYNAEKKSIAYANLPGNNSEIMVYDITGRMVNHKVINSSSGEVEAAGLSTGLYHVQIAENGAKRSFKIVVQ